MSEPVVRPATEADLEGIADVYEAVAAEGRWIGAEAPVDRPGAIERFRATVSDPEQAMLIAVVDGTVIGQLGLHTKRGRAEIGMAIVDAWRGRGVGSLLMRAALDWARDRDIHKLTLMVWPHNERAIALYERFGFEREGYFRRHYRRANGEMWDAIAMGLIVR